MRHLRREIKTGNTVHYFFTSPRAFQEVGSLVRRDIVDACNFAYDMTFGGQGQHRVARTGGNHSRMNAEIFLNAFNGKLGEFAFKRYLEQMGLQVPSVDLDRYGLGEWDTADFYINNRSLSVKTIKHFSNLLLLEQGDWNAEGRYIPNLVINGGVYNYHILVRLKGNVELETVLKSQRKFYSTLTRDEVNALIHNYEVKFDLPGVAMREMVVEAIRNQQCVYQNEYIGHNTKIQADNYYIQSGDLIPIEDFVQTLLQPIV